MKTPKLTSLVEDLQQVKSVIEATSFAKLRGKAGAGRGKAGAAVRQAAYQVSRGTLPPGQGGTVAHIAAGTMKQSGQTSRLARAGMDAAARTKARTEDWSWYTNLSRIGAMQLLGAEVPASLGMKVQYEAAPVAGTGLNESDISMFRAMAGIVLVEDTAPSREELEAISFLAIIGEMADSNFADMIGIDEDTAVAIVEKFGDQMLDENAVTQAAVEARRRGAGRAVMDTAFDPEARTIALESAELILTSLVEMQIGPGAGKAAGRKALPRAWTTPKGTEAKRPGKKAARKSIKSALARLIRPKY